MDDKSRIATRRIGDDDGNISGDTKPPILYIVDDHLGSSSISISILGAFISGEEYYPFGETSFGSYGKKRYRFCGKEKDEESGLYYYGMRYYSAWTCRFVSVDPLAEKFPYYTPYQYAGNKPINNIDLDGGEPKEEPKTAGAVSIGLTRTLFGKQNRGYSINFDFHLAHTGKTMSSEFNLKFEYSSFSIHNSNVAKSEVLTLNSSILLGRGGNTNMLGSTTIGEGKSFFNPKGSSGFAGGGVGFTSINIKGKYSYLSNKSWNLIGRASVGSHSISGRLMEDYWPGKGKGSDHGSTGTFEGKYSVGFSGQFKSDVLSISYLNETFTEKAKPVPIKVGEMPDDLSINREGRKNPELYENVGDGRNYGNNGFNISYSSRFTQGSVKFGLEGGKQGAAFQNFFHEHIVSTPRFQHNTSYFGKFFTSAKFGITPGMQ